MTKWQMQSSTPASPNPPPLQLRPDQLPTASALPAAHSTDMIAGFCGETEEDHAASLDLLQQVGYEQVC